MSKREHSKIIGIVFAVVCVSLTVACKRNEDDVSVKSDTATNKVQQNTLMSGYKGFLEYCKEVKSAKLSTPIATTVNSILRKLSTNECEKASQVLQKTTELAIDGENITNLEPFAGLTNLTVLSLAKNKIESIAPLEMVPNLEQLYLDENQIFNIQPISYSTNLKILSLTKNNIKDIEPLAKLRKLSNLFLIGNKISNLTPLSELERLNMLALANNEITDVKPLAGLTNLTGLILDNNKIPNISSLDKLTNLVNLSLKGNSYTALKCPFKKMEVCSL